MSMRVLLWMPSGDEIPGGHRIQIEQTSKHLRELAVCTDISFSDKPELGGLDIVHGFGLTPAQSRRCKQLNIPLAVSSIYPGKSFIAGQHIDSRFNLTQMCGRARMGLVLFRSALKGQYTDKCESLVKPITDTRVCFEMADILLPNSCAEAEQIVSDLGVTTPSYVVPNAVDHTIFTMEKRHPTQDREGALYVGRFEPHKNQLGLIEAMRGSNIPVRLVGHQHPHHPAYYEKCLRRVGGNITILPGVPHEELPALYRAARVHVLPSWFETTGLVSLEASLCGCNVVTTDRGYAREYFQDMAWYCDPADRRSIRQAVETAYESPFREELRERILANFTWEHTARATVDGYQLARLRIDNRDRAARPGGRL